jgi:hypothetical protein
LPNIYESKALLAPSDESNSISGALGNYAGLAGMAGLNLGSSDESNSIKAMEKFRSLSFFEKNILPNIFLPDLMAIKSWNLQTNSIIYDDRLYNRDEDVWSRDYSFPQKQTPSAQESYQRFLAKHFSLSENKKNGFITLRVKHLSPYIAKEWAELIITQVNAHYRNKDKLESEKAVSYLNQQMSMTPLNEVKQALATLVQEETKKLTLIEAKEFYVFDYIDPPAVMEEKSEPKRALICIISMLLGGLLSIVSVLLREFSFQKNIS